MPKERTAINAQATLLNVKSGKTETGERYGYASSERTPKAALELTFKVELPGPKTVRRFSEWKTDYNVRNKATQELYRLHAQQVAASSDEPKPKGKRKDQQDDGYRPSEEEISTLLKPMWEVECAKTARHNTAAMNRAAVFGMFFALVNSTVELTIAPVQQPLELMPEEELPSLPAGDADDDPE